MKLVQTNLIVDPDAGTQQITIVVVVEARGGSQLCCSVMQSTHCRRSTESHAPSVATRAKFGISTCFSVAEHSHFPLPSLVSLYCAQHNN